MWDDEDSYVLVDPSLVEEDKGLFHSTHICPMSGKYCTSSCAWALYPATPGGEDRWVCGKALYYSDEDFFPQGVTWDYS